MWYIMKGINYSAKMLNSLSANIPTQKILNNIAPKNNIREKIHIKKILCCDKSCLHIVE